MNRHPASGPAPAALARPLRLLLLGVEAVCLALLLPLLAGAPAALAAAHAPASGRTPLGSRPPGGNIANPVVRAVDLAQPAIVRIGTEELATLSLQLCTRAVTLPLNGPPYQLDLLGSGAFISAHGDILTADHVVDVPDDEVALFAAQDIANVLDNQTALDPGCPGNLQVSAADVASGAVNFGFTAHVSQVRTLVWLSTGYSGPFAATSISTAASQDATKTVASSYNADDLAILHVNMDDTPSVRLDDSTAVAVQDQLTVIGFPGNGDINYDATNFLTPSVNQVMVSAIKTGDNGSALIQVGGNVERGDSGGPVLDSAGHIVGVVSFGAIADPLGDTTFLRTSDSALTLINNQGIDLAPGPFEQLWTSAFNAYAATTPGHWTTAAREMTELSGRYPQFQALMPYLTFARAAAASEAVPAQTTQRRPLPLPVLLAALVALVLLAAALGTGLWFLVRALRRPAPVAAALPAFVPAIPPPRYPSFAGSAPDMPAYPWITYPYAALPSGSSSQWAGQPGPGAAGDAVGDTAVGTAQSAPTSGSFAAPGAAGFGAAAPRTVPLGPDAAPVGSPASLPPLPAAGDPQPGTLAAPAAARTIPPGGQFPAHTAAIYQLVPRAPGRGGQPPADMAICANGHMVALSAAFCPWCGASVLPPALGDQQPPADAPAPR